MGKRKQLKRELEQTKALLSRLYYSTELFMFHGPSETCEKCGAPKIFLLEGTNAWKPNHYPWCIFSEVGEFLGVVDTQVIPPCSCFVGLKDFVRKD